MSTPAIIATACLAFLAGSLYGTIATHILASRRTRNHPHRF